MPVRWVDGWPMAHMKDGDVAGFSAFNGHSALLSVVAEGEKKCLSMSTNIVNLAPKDKAVLGAEINDKAKIELNSNFVYLRIETNFNLGKDWATFFYSLDNKEWIQIGEPFKMIFDYQKLFMGTRYAIYNYATKSTAGYVDIDFFEYVKKDHHIVNK